MQILQHYYTSFINRQTGNAGFQVKALSPELSPDAQSLITRLIAYRIPPTLDERALATHPIALRYYYENSQRAYLLCSQSNGPDENGRPGNFFAHTLILEPEGLKHIPPILYWNSSFWLTKATSIRGNLDPLPPEQMASALEIEGVWTFLQERKRLAYFSKLMSAVIHVHRTRRRIVIIDSAKHVALWIAAVSCMLPPDCRPLLSFATYHHDPYQSQFLITGTTSDSSFRASADEYMTFFILNTEIDRVSDVDPSPYAEEATRAGESIEEYETCLLSLFGDYVQRFPPVERIDEQLDQLVRYAHMLSQPEVVPQKADLEAIDTVLTTFEKSFSREDVDELEKLYNILQNAWYERSENSVKQALERIIQLYKMHTIPTDALIMRSLQGASQLFLDAKREEAETDLAWMHRSYDHNLFEKAVNNPEYWKWLDRTRNQRDARQLTDIWIGLGSFIRFESTTTRNDQKLTCASGSEGNTQDSASYSSPNPKQFLLVSLETWGEVWNEEQGKSLYDAIALAWTGREEELLRFAVDHHYRLPRNTLILIYCHLVYTFELEKRAPYRTRVHKVVSDIAKHELIYQISMAKEQQGLAAGLQEFERWIGYARRNQIGDIPLLINEGLRCLKTIAKQASDEWKSLASSILTSKELAPLPQHWENELVEDALSKISLSHCPPTDLEMCEKYCKYEGIKPERRVVMRGLLAMNNEGQLDQALSADLLEYFMMHQEQYKEEADSFVQKFFAHPLKEQEHNLMINAVFTWRSSEYLWEPYWKAYRSFVETSQMEKVANVLAYWFAATPQAFERDYIPQYFFLHLPGQIDQWQKERGFPAAAQQINTIIANRQESWHPLLQDLLTSKKSLLASAGQNIGAVGLGLVTQLRRRLDSQYANQQFEKTQANQQWPPAFSDSVARLFNPKDVREAHRLGLQKTYPIEHRESFWECYWQHMTDLFLSQDAALMLDLLAYWFEDGYSTLEQQLYLVPAFFLGFADAIDHARKERRFGESARRVHECAQKDQYFWYSLVQKYFIRESSNPREVSI